MREVPSIAAESYHVFINFKKEFDMIWHAALWVIMRKYKINANLVCVIKHPYNSADSAVSEWQHRRMVQNKAGVSQGCPISPTLFSIFLEIIMFYALEEHDGKVSLGCRTIINPRFADDADAFVKVSTSPAQSIKWR